MKTSTDVAKHVKTKLRKICPHASRPSCSFLLGRLWQLDVVDVRGFSHRDHHRPRFDQHARSVFLVASMLVTVCWNAGMDLSFSSSHVACNKKSHLIVLRFTMYVAFCTFAVLNARCLSHFTPLLAVGCWPSDPTHVFLGILRKLQRLVPLFHVIEHVSSSGW